MGKKQKDVKTMDDYPEMYSHYDFDAVRTAMRSHPFDTEDLYDKVCNALVQAKVPKLAWTIDCDHASRFFHSARYEDLVAIGSEGDKENGTVKDIIQAYEGYRLEQVRDACNTAQDHDTLRKGLLEAYELCYLNVLMPEKIVQCAPPVISKVLELYAYTFGLTDFLQRVKEERDRTRHHRAMTILRDLHQLQHSGAACRDSNDMLMYLKRAKPAFAYIERFYAGTPLGHSFSASIVARALEAVERRVPQLQMPYKLSAAYDKTVMGGEHLTAEEAVQLLNDIAQYMSQNEALFLDEISVVDNE